MSEEKAEPIEIELDSVKDLEKYPRTKATLMIMAAVVTSVTYMAAVMGFDLKPILEAREKLEVAKIEYESKKMDLAVKKMEFEMYLNMSKCSVDPETLRRLDQVEELAHKPSKQ